ncbi:MULTISPECIES: LysR family transcriptional regulator [Psychrobacter]|jgi:DNA-binding transcriptional LysR family regulator|uniref:LysR family transcriptional regulator n=1 Tax=Psychrobacter TaxID=497 RepID=UPI003FD69778
MITLKQLRCFVTVVKTGGFLQASIQLNLTQPTVTKSISNLEEYLGVALFDKPLTHRKKRLVNLTEIGEHLYIQAVDILQKADNLEQTVVDYQQLIGGKLRLGISPLGSEILSKAIFNFYQMHPSIETSLIEDGAESLKQALLEGQLDVATLMKPIDDDFDYSSICCYPVVVVANKNRMGKRKTKVTLKSLSNAPLILFTSNSSFTPMIIENCQSLGFEPNIICQTNQWHLLLDMVKQDMGVTLLPQYYTQKLDLTGLVCLPLTQPQLKWELVMAWRRHRLLTPSMQAWLDNIRKNI